MDISTNHYGDKDESFNKEELTNEPRNNIIKVDGLPKDYEGKKYTGNKESITVKITSCRELTENETPFANKNSVLIERLMLAPYNKQNMKEENLPNHIYLDTCADKWENITCTPFI